MNLTLSDTAYSQIGHLLKEHDKKFVRLQVKGGGCAGFNYQLDVTDEKKDTDQELAFGNVRVLIDPKCELFVLGVEIGYKDEIMGSYFTYENPNAKSSCGCGTSFSA